MVANYFPKGLRVFVILLVFGTLCMFFYFSYVSRSGPIPYDKLSFSPRPGFKKQQTVALIKETTTVALNFSGLNSSLGPFAFESSSAIKRRLALEDEVQIALNKATEKKNILVWQLPFKPDPYMHSPDPKKCGNCDLLWDKKAIDDPRTKAVLFYFDQLHNMPKKRNMEQIWGFWTREAPPASRILRNLKFDKFDNFFNFTMMFRRNADIWDPYDTATTILGHVISSSADTDDRGIGKIVARKKGIAAWVVSNCWATPGAKVRTKLVEELVDHGLDVDRRGSCFGKRVQGDVREFIADYKFYLAFENSRHCNDYITEKLTVNSLMSGAVPVVFGARRQQVEQLVPPGSFIHVDDFPTTRHLVDHLRYLDTNATAYRELLEWRLLRHQDMPSYAREANFCQLCRTLHGINVDNLFNTDYERRYADKPLFGHYPMRVASVNEWYYGTEDKDCLSSW